jgi:hypothetical protein
MRMSKLQIQIVVRWVSLKFQTVRNSRFLFQAQGKEFQDKLSIHYWDFYKKAKYLPNKFILKFKEKSLNRRSAMNRLTFQSRNNGIAKNNFNLVSIRYVKAITLKSKGWKIINAKSYFSRKKRMRNRVSSKIFKEKSKKSHKHRFSVLSMKNHQKNHLKHYRRKIR